MKFGVLVLTFLSVASLAASQDATAEAPTVETPADEAEARRLFERATEAFEAGRNRDALRDFQQVHELTGRVEFLFNIGIAHQRLGDVAEARDHFERYLVATPDASNRADVEARIAELRGLEAGVEGGVENNVEANLVPDGTDTEHQRSPVDAPSRGIGPLLLGLGGAALAAGGTVLFGVGAARTGTLNDSQGREWADAEADQDGARALQVVGLSVAAVGVALAVGALVWMLTSRTNEPGDLAWHF